MDAVHIYTDGSCIGNPGPGGWAYLIRNNKHHPDFTETGHKLKATNQQMELWAALAALIQMNIYRQINPASVRPLKIYTDSEYVQKGMTTWIKDWKRNGWRNAKNKPIQNQDLWHDLDQYASIFDIQWISVKAHLPKKDTRYNPYHAQVDDMARSAAQQAQVESCN